MIDSRCDDAPERFFTLLALRPAMLVRVAATQGSVPREVGAWMAVFADAVVGTVGGGHLEYQAIATARARLAAGEPASWPETSRADAGHNDTKLTHAAQPVRDETGCGESAPALVRFALGPSLGQCCGGVVQLRFQWVSARDLPALALALRPELTPVALFGGGHVGHALARVLAPLPFLLTWIDSRDGVFPDVPPARALCEHSEPVQAAVPGLAAQSRVLIMSFSHAEDLEVVAACLQRQRERADLPYIGLIGSCSKWAAFKHRLQARGFLEAELAQVTCPIGVVGISGKAPEIIAVAVAAQLLQTVHSA